MKLIKEYKLKNKIIVDTDKVLDYEKNSFIKKILNFFIIPILNLIPPSTQKIIKKSHKSVSDIIENATSHAALEILYKKGNVIHNKNFLNKVAHFFWFNTNNSKGVRNRIKLVKRELTNNIIKFSRITKSIRILSIASGSARAIIESLIDANLENDVLVHVTFLDKSKEALIYSKNMTIQSELDGKSQFTFHWVNNTVNEFLDSTDEKYSVIEMVGLMDYFEDDKALKIFKKIYNLLDYNGVFITANINNNSEKKFVTKAIGWPMVYRIAEHLGELVINAGFVQEKIIAFYEPLKIHSIIIAKK